LSVQVKDLNWLSSFNPGGLAYMAAARLWMIVLLLVLTGYSSKAERGEVITEKSRISFSGSSNIHTFEGRIPNFKGFLYGDSKDFRSVNYMQIEFDVLSFSTGNTARDENMRKMFAVKEQPDITFRATNILIAHDRAFADVTGKLTIKNVTRRIVFTAYL